MVQEELRDKVKFFTSSHISKEKCMLIVGALCVCVQCSGLTEVRLSLFHTPRLCRHSQ